MHWGMPNGQTIKTVAGAKMSACPAWLRPRLRLVASAAVEVWMDVWHGPWWILSWRSWLFQRRPLEDVSRCLYDSCSTSNINTNGDQVLPDCLDKCPYNDDRTMIWCFAAARISMLIDHDSYSVCDCQDACPNDIWQKTSWGGCGVLVSVFDVDSDNDNDGVVGLQRWISQGSPQDGCRSLSL